MSKMSTIALTASETDMTDPYAIRRAAVDLAIEFFGVPTSDQVAAVRTALVSTMGEHESVAQYNNIHAGKAWAVIGVTHDISAFCARCAADEPLAIWHPIFASDDYDGTTCDECLKVL